MSQFEYIPKKVTCLWHNFQNCRRMLLLLKLISVKSIFHFPARFQKQKRIKLFIIKRKIFDDELKNLIFFKVSSNKMPCFFSCTILFFKDFSLKLILFYRSFLIYSRYCHTYIYINVNVFILKSPLFVSLTFQKLL